MRDDESGQPYGSQDPRNAHGDPNAMPGASRAPVPDNVVGPTAGAAPHPPRAGDTLAAGADPRALRPGDAAAAGPDGATPGDPTALRRDPGAVRAEDTEPYIGLQYVARLFKIVAMIVIVAIIAEIVAGVAYEGARALLPLFTEIIQGGVLAAMLWGAGDLTLLFIDVGHDVRAGRVLLGRMSARAGGQDLAPPRRERSRDR